MQSFICETKNGSHYRASELIPLIFKNKIERRGRQNKNNRPINLPNVITFSTDFKYTKKTINHDLYFFQLWVSIASCQLFSKASSLVLLSSSVSTANLSCLLATTFSSLRFLFNFTSLQSFESGQALFLAVFYFLIFWSYPESSAFLSSVLPSLKLCLL